MIGVRTDSGEGAHNYRMFRGDETYFWRTG